MKKSILSLLLSLLFVLSGYSQTITWTKVWSTPAGSPNPFYNGYHDIHWSDYIGRVLINSTRTAGNTDSIYSDRLWFFDPVASTAQLIQDNGQLSSGSCVPDLTNTPGTRHPVGQIWVDKARNRLWMMEGVCQGHILPDMWYYQLDNPISGHSDWIQVHPAHLPTSTVGGLHGIFNNASVVHDTDHDAFILFGYDGGSNSHAMQVYCDTSLNGGILTPEQISVGCSISDDWTDITSQVTLNGPLPPGYYYPNLEYATIQHRVIQFAGLHGATTIENQTWDYDPVLKKWANENPLNPPANSSDNNENGRVAHAYDTDDGNYYYHLTAHTPGYGLAPSRPPEDWRYNLTANIWTKLDTGNGPYLSESMTYIGNGMFVAWAAKVNSDGKYYATGIAEMWIGKIQ